MTYKGVPELKPKGAPGWLSKLRLEINKLVQERREIERELMNPLDMRKGVLVAQYRRCGKSNCRCMDAKEPVKHGPYHYLYSRERGKAVFKYVKDEVEIKRYQNYKTYYHLNLRYKKISKQIIELLDQIKQESTSAH